MHTEQRILPKWLRRLERESWQAELIISGAAILGTLQLPWLLEQLQHYLLLNYDRSALKLWFLATTYWALFVYGLPILFILHFVIRALWIGLVGLNSVHPKGIPDNPISSEDMQAKMRAEYGDIGALIRKLDNSASGMFGYGFTLAGLFLNLGLMMSVSILLITLLQKFGVSSTLAWVIGLAPITILVALSFISTLLNLKSFRDKPWVKKYHFPVVQAISKLTYPLNRRFTVTGTLLMSGADPDEVKKPGSLVGGFLVIILCSVLLGMVLGFSNALKQEFNDGFYWRMGSDPTYIRNNAYADRDQDGLLFQPMINSVAVEAGAPLWVWVPLPERELSIMLESCGAPAVDDDLPRDEERIAERARVIACADEYVELFLDDEPVTLPPAFREYRTSAGFDQLGIRFSLTGLSPTVGWHLLRVVTHYSKEVDEAGDYRTTYINFEVVEHAPN